MSYSLTLYAYKLIYNNIYKNNERKIVLYIILELLLIENFIINLLILYITKIITRTSVNKKRIIFGAAIISFYSLAFFWEYSMLLTNFYMKIVISLFLIKICFNAKSIKLYFYQLLAFYIVSFIFAGATFGFFFSSQNIQDLILKPIDFIGGFPVIYLILGILSSSVIAIIIFKYNNKKTLREDYIMDINIIYKEKSIEIKALIDTGNSLIDPFTKETVILIEYNKIKDLLPPIIWSLYEKDKIKDFKLLETVLKTVEKEITIKLIPFKSVGNNNGFLLGFKPEFIILDHKSENRIIRKDIIIGIYQGLLSTDESYNGLLNYEILMQEAV